MKRLLLSLLAGGAAAGLLRPPAVVPYKQIVAGLDAVFGPGRATFSWRLGNISYRVAGSGAPVVLVHGIHAAASSYEMRHTLAGLASDFRVYAPDFLGFGLSNRPQLRYTAAVYTDLLLDFLREVVGSPAHVIASSLSSAYAVVAASAHPELVQSLILICPTGIEKLSGPPTVGQRVADRLIGLPLIGSQLFAGLISRPSIRFFLRSMTYRDRSLVTHEMVDLFHRLGQRPGARWAPQAFLGGRLNLNIARAFADLPMPVTIVWGRHARTTPLGDAPAFLEQNPQVTLKVFENADMLPHDEEPDAFNAFAREWIKEDGA